MIGLGKTVTALALIACTAGTMPCKPVSFWDEDVIEESWRHLHNRHEGMLAPIINKLRQTQQLEGFRHPMLIALLNILREGTARLADVEATVKKWIRAAAFTHGGRDQLLSKFAHGMLISFFIFRLFSNFLIYFVTRMESAEDWLGHQAKKDTSLLTLSTLTV